MRNPNQHKINYKTIFVFLLIVLLMIVATVTTLIIYGQMEMELYEKEQQNMIDDKLKNVQVEISRVVSDLKILAECGQLEKLWEDPSNNENVEMLIESFYNVALYRKLYDQVRLIDENYKSKF